MKILGIIGTKDTGKTTLVTRLIKGLTDKGYKVGTIKHTHGRFDFPGKDTEIHRKAGAKLVIGAGKETFFFSPKEKNIKWIISTIPFIEEIDFLIIEGFKKMEFANISTSIENEFTIKKVDPFSLKDGEFKEILQLTEKRTYGLLLGLNCGKCGFESCEEFARAKVKGDADDVNCKSQFKRAMLRINGNPIPLNPFVQKIMSETITGMVKSLQREETEIDKIEIIIKW
ncbi:MAG: molybdopterin-guanine dinucleotide biosynthesis protein B [Methanobacteriales archaeon]|nr:molybdopterin-guanine dinucleotide biosynthesis protein B [Methanobacteriales archaeon]